MRRLALTALPFCMALAACGSTSTPSGTGTTVPRSTTSTTATPPTTAPAAACSAAGLSPQVPAETGLSTAAATMRADLARAAVSCDWTELAALADRNGKAVRFSFGSETDPAQFWKAAEAGDAAVKPMRALRLLLGLPYATSTGNGVTQYVWPPAFASEHPTASQLQQVADTGLYSMATLNGWVAGGNNYLGYRIFITASGDWTLFVEGD